MILLCAVLWAFQIPAQELGIYKGLVVTKVGDQYVFASREENAIVLADASGKVAARYNKAGSGPEELTNPSYLGFYQNHHLVMTQDRFLIAFDQHLKPSTKFTRLPKMDETTVFVAGLYTDQGLFWVHSGLSLSSHIVLKMNWEGSEWHVDQRLFPQSFSNANAAPDKNFMAKILKNSRVEIHNAKAFHGKGSFSVDLDDYTVNVHDRPDQDKDPDMVLQADIRDRLPVEAPIPLKGFFLQGFTFPDGFAIVWEGLAHRGDRMLTTYLDIFKPNGGFLKRARLENPVFPCLNSADFFYFKEVDGKEFLFKGTQLKDLEAITLPE